MGFQNSKFIQLGHFENFGGFLAQYHNKLVNDLGKCCKNVSKLIHSSVNCLMLVYKEIWTYLSLYEEYQQKRLEDNEKLGNSGLEKQFKLTIQIDRLNGGPSGTLATIRNKEDCLERIILKDTEILLKNYK